MRKSILLLGLVSIVSALIVGCIPNADRGPTAFAPREYLYTPQVYPSSPHEYPTTR
jgi:hypothetical protein